MEGFYVKARKKKKIKITIDGMFIGVRGKKFEKASKMYSGNKQDKGKVGYTLVTCFDTINKLPMGFEVPIIHEINAALFLIKKAITLEEKGKITIDLFVLDSLYFSKEIFRLLSGYLFIIRAPAYEWILEHVDKISDHGCKEIVLWGNKVLLYCRLQTHPNHSLYPRSMLYG